LKHLLEHAGLESSTDQRSFVGPRFRLLRCLLIPQPNHQAHLMAALERCGRISRWSTDSSQSSRLAGNIESCLLSPVVHHCAALGVVVILGSSWSGLFGLVVYPPLHLHTVHTKYDMYDLLSRQSVDAPRKSLSVQLGHERAQGHQCLCMLSPEIATALLACVCPHRT